MFILLCTLISWGGVLLSEFAKILAGNRLLNWYFTEIIVLYILFAVSIKAARDSHKVLAIYNFILTTGMAGILCIMYLFGGVGLHWFISLYAFPFGVLFGVTGDKILKLVSSKKRIFLVGILFLIVFLCINYAKIWRYHILLKLTRILILCLSSVIFCVVICGIFRMYQSRGILSWIGKRSAEMILTQQIALHVFRNNIIYVKNDIMWVLGSLVMQVGLMMVVRPLYNQVRLKFK